MTRHPAIRRPRRRPSALVLVVALAVVAVTAGACSPATQLTGTTWQLTQAIEKVPPAEVAVPAEDQSRYTITFADDGTAAIKADCNNATATYTTATGGQFDITVTTSTAAACPEDSYADKFIAALGFATSYNRQGNQLTMYLSNEGSLVFAAAP